jgi:hypothetical protein
VPIKCGVDAATQQEAEALAIDHNNLSLSGGNFTGFDMARMWDEGYTEILAGLATDGALPITVDGDVLDGLLQQAGTGIIDANELWKGMPEFEQDDLGAWKSIKVHFANEQDYHAFARLMGQALTPQTKYIWYPFKEKIHHIEHMVEDES